MNKCLICTHEPAAAAATPGGPGRRAAPGLSPAAPCGGPGSLPTLAAAAKESFSSRWMKSWILGASFQEWNKDEMILYHGST